MMISPKLRLGFGKVLFFSIFWLIAALLYSIIERGIMGETGIYPATGNIYDFGSSVFTLIGFGFVMGGTLGSIEVFLFPDLFRKFPFGLKVVLKTIFYISGIIILMLILTFIMNSIRMDAGILDPEVFKSVEAFISAFAFWSIIIYGMFSIGVSLLIMEMRENIGVGIFQNFLFGRYQKPKEETRIFMFIDMKSSTSIAERLGHVRYFNLLNMYFEDLSKAILNNEGMVYQYAGDEIIVHWRALNRNNHNHALKCFFDMQDQMANQASMYQNNFGITPGFRAGMHLGTVTAGEIGTLKKEIIFTGDVLNTTSRIQSLCKDTEKDLLISSDMKDFLGDQSEFLFEEEGDFQLRGKEGSSKLFSVKKH